MHDATTWILAALSGVLTGLIGWLGRRVTDEQKEHDTRLRVLERDAVSREDIDRLADRITSSIERSQRDSAALFAAKLATVEQTAQAAHRRIDELRQ